MARQSERFTGRFAAIAVLAGSAIGLGNIWRFPFMVGENGGAAFIILYILCSILISVPAFLCESVIGRSSHSDVKGALAKFSNSSKWQILSTISIITSLIIVSYYSVVGGWTIDFLTHSIANGFEIESSTSIFSEISSSAWEPLICHTVFIALSSLIVLLGIKKGIEFFSKISIPILLLLVMLIAVYSIMMPGAEKGIAYLLKPDFGKLTPDTVIAAMGQSIYSMSLGIGVVLTYSAYIKNEENILSTSLWTALFDTIFAILASFAIMPAVFAVGLEPGSGPSLIFETLPRIFAGISVSAPVLGKIISTSFFLTVLVAAVSSEMSMIEVIVAYLINHKGISRKKAAGLVFIVGWFIGSLCCLSFGPLNGVKLFGLCIFEIADFLTANILMTFVALGFTIFAGWVMDREEFRREFTCNGAVRFNDRIFPFIHFIIKFIIPVGITIVFISGMLA